MSARDPLYVAYKYQIALYKYLITSYYVHVNYSNLIGLEVHEKTHIVTL